MLIHMVSYQCYGYGCFSFPLHWWKIKVDWFKWSQACLLWTCPELSQYMTYNRDEQIEVTNSMNGWGGMGPTEVAQERWHSSTDIILTISLTRLLTDKSRSGKTNERDSPKSTVRHSRDLARKKKMKMIACSVMLADLNPCFLGCFFFKVKYNRAP